MEQLPSYLYDVVLGLRLLNQASGLIDVLLELGAT
jgi:hypothetical protein